MRWDGKSLERVSQKREVFVCTTCVCTNRFLWDLLEFVRGEVWCIGDGPQMRNKRCIDLANGVPVYTVEEGMLFDLFNRHTLILGRNQPKRDGIRICVSILDNVPTVVLYPLPRGSDEHHLGRRDDIASWQFSCTSRGEFQSRMVDTRQGTRT